MNKPRESALAARPVHKAPAAYRQRLADMQSAAARARTFAGLDLLTSGLKQLGLATEIDGIGFAAGGRPELHGGPSFSISHSGQTVACAIAQEQTIGLDIEARRDNISARLAATIQAGLAANSPWDFFDAWCAREAAVKASGRVGLARIRQLEFDGANGWLDDQRWYLRPLGLVDGLAGFLASDQPIRDISVREISLDHAE
ncbi:MAG: hypothetical protein PF501_20270 [Salinisphaera sp.]|jgi:4'-phosphopantetheinyl transferase|nr:hypothetical protein [Salinisphaera sp.]